MARTRAQAAGKADADASPQRPSAGAKRSGGAPSASSKKRKLEGTRNGPSDAQPPEPKKQDASSSSDLIARLLDEYGTLPLSGTAVKDPTTPTASTLLAHVLHAMLSSARISHDLAAKALACCIQAGYHELAVLKKSSWEERTKVLTEGGYTRYREKMATALGKLAELVESDYDGDLNTIFSSNPSVEKARTGLKKINNLGDVGVNIFIDNAQGALPILAPFVDPRSLKTAEAIGLGSDMQKMWRAVEKDPVKMCRLAAALTNVRLQKAEGKFK